MSEKLELEAQVRALQSQQQKEEATIAKQQADLASTKQREAEELRQEKERE